MVQTAHFKKRLLGRWGKLKVYVVDDAAIRNSAKYAEEFGDYGVNLGEKGLTTINFPFIGENEIWIAQSIKPHERRFVIDHALSYIRNIHRGIEPGLAYENALKHEQANRTKSISYGARLKRGLPQGNLLHKDIGKKVYVRKYIALHTDTEIMNVYLVDGEYVRDLYKTDYVEGGHDYAYSWVPLNEIWVDASMQAEEIPVIVLHEFVERTLMRRKKLPYVRAHNAALKVEFLHRGIFHKEDLKALDEKMVLQKLLKAIRY